MAIFILLLHSEQQGTVSKQSASLVSGTIITAVLDLVLGLDFLPPFLLLCPFFLCGMMSGRASRTHTLGNQTRNSTDCVLSAFDADRTNWEYWTIVSCEFQFLCQHFKPGDTGSSDSTSCVQRRHPPWQLAMLWQVARGLAAVPLATDWNSRQLWPYRYR